MAFILEGQPWDLLKVRYRTARVYTLWDGLESQTHNTELTYSWAMLSSKGRIFQSMWKKTKGAIRESYNFSDPGSESPESKGKKATRNCTVQHCCSWWKRGTFTVKFQINLYQKLSFKSSVKISYLSRRLTLAKCQKLSLGKVTYLRTN